MRIRYFELSVEQRGKLYRSVLEESHPDPEYLAMLAFSGLIALFGLLQNSTAVIIGAMLISPLMNPILAASLALILGDGILGRKTAIILGMSIGGVILVTWVVAWLSPLKEMTPEILARSNPNLLDLFIAFLSGLAGAIALRGGSTIMTIVPGVAIAVAVIPPLAVVGFGLSARQTATAGGAFLLFMTNLVAIILSAALVFRLFGFRAREEREKGRLKLSYRLAISFLLLTLLSIPLFHTLRKAVRQIGLRKGVSAIVDGAFKTDHSSVADLTLVRPDEKLQVRATLRTTRYFETADIQAAQESLRNQFGPAAQLDVEQILVAQGGLSPQQRARVESAITGGVVRPIPGAEEAPFDLKANRERMLAHLQRQVDETLAGTSIRRTGALRVQLGMERPLVFEVQLSSPEPLEPQTITLLASQLGSKTSGTAELHGEVELLRPVYTHVVDSWEPRKRLPLKDRQAIAQLGRVVRNRPDLGLQVTLSNKVHSVEAFQNTAGWRQIQAILSRAGLKSSRWSLQVAQADRARSYDFPEEAQTAAVEAEAASGVRCEFKLFQDF